MAFDPDAYLSDQGSSSSFDPDAYLGTSSQNQQPMTLQGLASNVLPDVGRIASGLASQAYNIPKAAIMTPIQLAQGKPLQQTAGGQFLTGQMYGAGKGIQSFANDPLGAMYRNPVTTALVASSIAKPMISGIQSAGIRGMSAALGPSTEAIEARMANPSAIANAPSYADLAETLPNVLNQLKDQITNHAEAAYSTLRDSIDPAEGAIPKSDLVNIWGDLMKKLQTDDTLVGPAKKAAANTLTSVVDDGLSVAKGSPMLAETHIKGILKSIDPNIDWTDKGASATNSILTDLRGQLDQGLKTGNQDYANAMQPVAQKIGLLDSLKRAFNITNVTGEGLQPTDTTISKIQALPTERKSITQGLAQQLQQATGTDLTQQAKTYGLAKQFQGGATQGSRRVNLGALVGGPVGAGAGYMLGSPATGALIGEGIGAGVGALADKFGGAMAGRLADVYSPVYQGISQLASSIPGRTLTPAALEALLGQIYSQQGGQK